MAKKSQLTENIFHKKASQYFERLSNILGSNIMALAVRVAVVVNELPHGRDACNTCDACGDESVVAPTEVVAAEVVAGN